MRQIGVVVIKHGQLEHVQKIALKRILKITVHDKRYVDAYRAVKSRAIRARRPRFDLACSGHPVSYRDLAFRRLNNGDRLGGIRQVSNDKIWRFAPPRSTAGHSSREADPDHKTQPPVC